MTLTQKQLNLLKDFSKTGNIEETAKNCGIKNKTGISILNRLVNSQEGREWLEKTAVKTPKNTEIIPKSEIKPQKSETATVLPKTEVFDNPKEISEVKIADNTEIKQFLSAVVRGQIGGNHFILNTRLKAAELLTKSNNEDKPQANNEEVIYFVNDLEPDGNENQT